MREILFRGKRADNGEWVCSGNLIQFFDNNIREVYISQYGERCNAVHDIDTDNIETITCKNGARFYKVIPETVGQYTGLTDKNGTKIFEGDILEFTDSDGVKSPYIIEWEEVDCCYVIERPDGEWFEILEPEQYRHNCVCDDYISDDCVNWRCDRFEIISNIHDNPDFFDGTSYDEI